MDHNRTFCCRNCIVSGWNSRVTKRIPKEDAAGRIILNFYRFWIADKKALTGENKLSCQWILWYNK